MAKRKLKLGDVGRNVEDSSIAGRDIIHKYASETPKQRGCHIAIVFLFLGLCGIPLIYKYFATQPTNREPSIIIRDIRLMTREPKAIVIIPRTPTPTAETHEIAGQPAVAPPPAVTSPLKIVTLVIISPIVVVIFGTIIGWFLGAIIWKFTRRHP